MPIKKTTISVIADVVINMQSGREHHLPVSTIHTHTHALTSIHSATSTASKTVNAVSQLTH